MTSRPFDMNSTLQALLSHLEGNGYFHESQIGEPKGPVAATGTEYFGSLIPSEVRIAKIVLDGSPIEVHTVILRIYADWMAEPQEQVEISLSNTVSRVISDLIGGFKLNNTVRAVDFAGIYGRAITARWGHLDLSKRIYRVCDVSIPCIVDDDFLDVAE